MNIPKKDTASMDKYEDITVVENVILKKPTNHNKKKRMHIASSQEEKPTMSTWFHMRIWWDNIERQN